MKQQMQPQIATLGKQMQPKIHTGSPDVRIKPQSVATYLADPRDRLKSIQTSTRGQKSHGPRTQARRLQRHAATLGNKAATIRALAQAVADAISAANADLTAIASAARTCGNSSPPLPEAPQ